MEPPNFDATSLTGTESVSFTPGTEVLHHHVHTSYPPLNASAEADIPHSQPATTASVEKKRRRKSRTKEISPDDIQGLVALGMSPFMPGLDPIANQNRFVRNETILARQVSRLQASITTAEGRHAQRAQDIYRILTEHETIINNLSKAQSQDPSSSSSSAVPAPVPMPTSSIVSDPEFAAQVQAHIETREALNAVISKISASAASTKKAIERLTQRISELESKFCSTHDQTQTACSSRLNSPSDWSSSTPRPLQTSELLPLSRQSTTSFTPSLHDFDEHITSHIGAKRKRSMQFAQSQTTQRLYQSPSPIGQDNPTTPEFPAAEVVYGPIINTTLIPRTPETVKTIAEEAVRNVGLDAGMIYSVRPAPAGMPQQHSDSIIIRFWKHDHARRFVDLVVYGLDGYAERRASLLLENL
ncbi:hypothetical protein CPC08DRAFT_197530 [Agrocybe pediades]|nr:hypothetical protein CPC08DRAFT_197530 [Agrocybe pediades]